MPRIRGIRAVIACLRSQDVGFEREVMEAGHDVRLLPGSGTIAKIRSLRRLIAELEPSLVYTSLYDADIAGRLASIGKDVPVMSLLANTAYDPARLADPNVRHWRLGLAKALDGVTARHLTDHFHAVSQAVKDSTVETLGVDAERITVVHRGRDVIRLGEASYERRSSMRAALGLAADAEVVVTVGRQEYQKGQTHLIDAFVGVAATRPRAVLLIVGREGHASADLRAQVTGLDLDERVTFLGHRSDVPDILATGDLFVFPSVYEGLGGALIEALALSLPVVASDLPALHEVVEVGGNATLVPAGDARGLKRAIVGLLEDPELRARYGGRSRQLFEERFRAEGAASRFVELLESVAR